MNSIIKQHAVTGGIAIAAVVATALLTPRPGAALVQPSVAPGAAPRPAAVRAAEPEKPPPEPSCGSGYFADAKEAGYALDASGSCDIRFAHPVIRCSVSDGHVTEASITHLQVRGIAGSRLSWQCEPDH